MAENLLAASSDLQVLVNELSKTNPDSKLIKNKTDVLGIPYSNDIIVLMSEVLVHLSKNNILKRTSLKDKIV